MGAGIGIWLVLLIVALAIMVEGVVIAISLSTNASLKERLETEIPKALDEARKMMKARESEIRKDAIARSKAVGMGRAAETMVPLLESWPWDPADCHFLGSPVDYLVFEGLTDGELEKIVIVEVKTGSSRMTRRQHAVRHAIEEGRVAFKEVRL